MSLFPMLDAKPLPELIALFLSDPLAHGVEPDEAELFFQETAVRIAKCGYDGAVFLLDNLQRADTERVRALLLALSFIDKDTVNQLADRIKCVLASYLSSSNPYLVAESVDSINHLGLAEMADAIIPLLKHESPYIVASVHRFLSSHFPARKANLDERIEIP